MTVQPSGKLRKNMKRAALAVLAFHAAAIAAIVISVAFPNIFKRYSGYNADLAADIPHEVVMFSGRRGNPLHGWFFANPASRRAVLLCHGRSRNKAYELPYVKNFLKRYNVFVFDFTGHGENPYAPTSIGYHESEDVLGAVDWLGSRGFNEIAVMGHSMGGAAAIKALAEYGNGPVRIRALVTEGAFARLEDLLSRQVSQFYVPWTVWRPAFRLAEIIGKYRISENAPERSIREVRCPALFMQADADALAPADSALRLGLNAGGTSEAAAFGGRHDVPNAEVSSRALAFLLARWPE